MIRITQTDSISVPIKLVELLTTVFPLVIIGSAFVLTLLIVINAIRNNETSRWNRLRDRLALLFSGGVFYEVKENIPEKQSTINNGNNTDIEPLVLETEKKDHNKHACYAQECLISAPAQKEKFYSMYVLSVPLQIAMICLIILDKIFVGELNFDSCASYIAEPPSDLRYYCRLSNETILPSVISKEKIHQFCNSTIVHGNYSTKFDDIVCLEYYFDKTKILEIVTHLVVWQKVLAAISIRLIRSFHKIYRRFSPFTKVHKCCFYFALLFLVIINFAFILAAVSAYVILGNRDTQTILAFNSITAGMATLALTFFIMNIFAWFIIPEDSEYRPCVFHVTLKSKTN